MKIRATASSLAILIALFITNAAHAATSALSLAAHAPADAVVYLGWAGSETLAPDFAKSPLRTLIAGSNIQAVAEELLPKLWDYLSADPADKDAVDAVRRVLPVLWHHPTSLFGTDVIVVANGEPIVHVGLVCDAGADADQLLADLNVIAKSSPDRLKIDRDGSIIRLTNYDITPGETLDRSKPFLAAMKPLQATPAIVVFIDGDGILRKANEAGEKGDSAKDIWPKVRDALGIAGVKSYAMTAGFEAGNWATASALIAPVPRTGLLAVIEPKPIDPALLARIPATAEAVTVYNFDAAKLYDAVAAAMAVTPASDTAFHRGNGAGTMLLGRNIRRAILGPLGSQWVIYTDIQTHNTTLLNHPADADTVSDSMVSVAFGLINTINAQMPDAGVQAVQQKIDGIGLTSAKSSRIEEYVGSPTFAVKDGIFYFGQSPAAVVAAANLTTVPEAQNALHDSTFATTLFRLHVPSAGSIDYCDLSRTAPRGWRDVKTALDLLQSWAQLTKLMNADVPVVKLTPIEQIQHELSPSLCVSWADADGIYTKSISPFPLSGALLGDPQEMVVSLGTVSMAAGAIVPAITRARGQAMNVETMSREHQLLLTMINWSIKNNGQFPPDLGSLIGPQMITDPKLFLRPKSGTKVPPAIASGTVEQQAAWVNDHAEFRYLAGNKHFTDNANTTPVLVEEDPTAATGYFAVGFADGHVEMVSLAMASKFVNDANK